MDDLNLVNWGEEVFQDFNLILTCLTSCVFKGNMKEENPKSRVIPLS